MSNPYPRERLWSDCEDELSEVKQLLQETRRRNEVLANENYNLKQTLKTVNEQVFHLKKIFDKLKKDMGYG